MSSTCATCQYWKSDEDRDYLPERIGFRWCTRVRERWRITDMGDRYLEEDWEALQDEQDDRLRKARAYVQDGSEYIASLITGPDFGCVLWGPPSPAQPQEGQA